ncbi:fructose-2,6-bisphosphatase [Longilinea arvoryzae]|uniref:Fructose-2,6-bisphosphatase n=1 Tax=Longilinea arvoryzae TaxID=360412 RepID=A0A0S7BKD9_9CHLR|nr:histidine phosphatase family protein [Longilinea arvoryzae]GAP14982.1 fructose-2,6-bisphosphatase [Longilinea arvoryzae]
MSTWIFARHGESEANLLHEFSNRGLKHGLTELGFQQAAHLAQEVSAYPVKEIYCSPLLRARQTAEVIGYRLNLVPQVKDALVEFDTGALEGKTDPESWQAFDEIFQAWLLRKDYSRCFSGGDSFDSIRDRFLPFIQALQEANLNSDRALLFIGHGGTYLCVLPLILKNIDFDFVSRHYLSHTGMVIAEEQKGELFCKVWDGLRL